MSSIKMSSPSISCGKINIGDFDITKPEDNDRSPAQKLSYVRYKNKGRTSQLNIKTPVIHMTTGGLPKEDPLFFPDDKARAKSFKIPFNKETPEEIEFYEKFSEIDEWMSSENFKKDVLGLSEKMSQTYDYNTIVKRPQEKDEDEDDDNNKNKKSKIEIKRPEYMKAVFDLDYNTSRVNTKIIYKNGEEKTIVEIETLKEAEQYIKWMGKNKYIITPNKIYLSKSKDNKTGKKYYGMTFKIVCIEAEPPTPITSSYNPTDPFISDDEDDELPSISASVKKISLAEAEEAEENEDEEEEEEEEKPAKVVKTNKKVVEEEQEEEEEEEEEEEIIQPKKKVSKAAKELDQGIDAKKKKTKSSSV